MTESIENQVHELAQRARKASFILATLSYDQKNAALESVALLIEKRADILSEKNNLDLEAGRQNGLSPALLDR
ncbi:MAG: gamma-glutamyl-phosphate reductase, partial [Opitutae bacterium]|nr:gamma-glutamyl-phosphate reductase [Opitutae bacterium]